MHICTNWKTENDQHFDIKSNERICKIYGMKQLKMNFTF